MTCAAHRPAALVPMPFVTKQVVRVKVITDALQSEPDVSETYNPQAKLLRISET